MTSSKNWQDNQLIVNPMESVAHTHTIHVDYEPQTAARLFTAEGEVHWTPNWIATLIKGDCFRNNDIFTNTHGTIFIVNDYDPERGHIAYSRVAPGMSAGTIEIFITPEGEGASVQITYRMTGLSEEGNESVRQMTADAYAAEMMSWEDDIKIRKNEVDQWLDAKN